MNQVVISSVFIDISSQTLGQAVQEKATEDRPLQANNPMSCWCGNFFEVILGSSRPERP